MLKVEICNFEDGAVIEVFMPARSNIALARSLAHRAIAQAVMVRSGSEKMTPDETRADFLAVLAQMKQEVESAEFVERVTTR